jgi:hypothetical protein
MFYRTGIVVDAEEIDGGSDGLHVPRLNLGNVRPVTFPSIPRIAASNHRVEKPKVEAGMFLAG